MAVIFTITGFDKGSARSAHSLQRWTHDLHIIYIATYLFVCNVDLLNYFCSELNCEPFCKIKRNNYVRLMAIKRVNVACADNMPFAR